MQEPPGQHIFSPVIHLSASLMLNIGIARLLYKQNSYFRILMIYGLPDEIHKEVYTEVPLEDILHADKKRVLHTEHNVLLQS